MTGEKENNLMDISLVRIELSGLEEKISDLDKSLNTEKIRLDIKKLEEEATHEGFWNDQENSQMVLQKIKQLLLRCWNKMK